MGNDPVTLEVQDEIATITFDRPETLNSPDTDALDRLLRHLYSIEGRDDVSAVIITGAGEKAFCAGFDLKEIPLDEGQQAVHEHFRISALYWHSVLPAIVRIKKPVLAAVNGIAVGGGLGTVLACDMAFASPDATFTPGFLGLGAGPDSGTTYHLPRILGLRRAIEWIWTNETIDAERAAEWDVVNRVVDDDVLSETREIAQQLVEGPTRLFAWTKLNMHRSFTENFETQTEWERQGVVDTIRTDYFWESMRGFMEEGEGNVKTIDLPSD